MEIFDKLSLKGFLLKLDDAKADTEAWRSRSGWEEDSEEHD